MSSGFGPVENTGTAFPRPAKLAVLGALGIGIAAFAIAACIEHGWLKTRPFWYDALAYSYQNAQLHAQIEREGRWQAAIAELQTNGRCPFRTVPAALLAPGTLAHPLGHIATSVPMFLAFCVLLAWTVCLRTKSVPYALASVVAFCSIQGLYNPERGMASNWLDFPASFLAGSAVLCLINSDSCKRLGWVVAFAVFASLAALSRYIFAFYLLFSAGPVLAFFLWRTWRSGEVNRWGRMLKPLAVCFSIIGVLALPWLIVHLKPNIDFYRSYGYALSRPIGSSFTWVLRCLTEDVTGLWWLLVLLAAFAVQATIARLDKRLDVGSLGVSLWLVLSHPFLLIVLLRVEDAGHASLYALPWLVLFALAPFPSDLSGCGAIRRRAVLLLSLLLSVLFLMCSTPYVIRLLRHADHPKSMERACKQFDLEMADVISRLDRPVVWNCYFDEYAPKPSLECFYKSGKLPLYAGQDYFNVHETAWRADYPGLSPQQIAERIYQASCRWVDVGAVLSDPECAMTNSYMTNMTSRLVAREMALRIARDGSWRYLVTLESPIYGRVDCYLNKAAHGRAYEALLYSRQDSGYHPRSRP